MILHRLIAHYVKHGDDAWFYLLQARDAVQWLEQAGVYVEGTTQALDLGCGHGVFGAELLKRGCDVTFADEDFGLLPEISHAPFRKINLERDDLATLGEYDLVVCSNVLEHLATPREFILSVHKVLKPQGKLYLSWTNWLSLWGGHEFSPFHYLGTNRGHRLYDRVFKRPRKHTPFVNLFPTYIGTTLKMIQRNPHLRIMRMSPRYYRELSFVMWIPGLREFLAWNCALLIGRHSHVPR